MDAVKKVLLLYMSIGSGHRSAAEAIEQAAKQAHLEWEITCLDPVSQLFPSLLNVFSGAYFNCLKLVPSIYGHLWSDKRAGKLVINLASSWMLLRKLEKMIERESPQVIVCTHAFTCNLIAGLKRRTGLRTPLIAVATDFGLPSSWTVHHVDRYIVAAEELGDVLQHRGVEASRIQATGIPISPAFAQTTDRERVRREKNLQALPTLLIVAGSLMQGPYVAVTRILKQLIACLDSLQTPFQALIVTGTNATLRRELEEIAHATSHPMAVFGYVSDLHDLMGVSDLLITKPGGMISAEALAKGLPMILVNPLPGQEEANARFLARNGVAVIANDASRITETVRRLLGDTTELQRMRRQAERLAKPNACYAALEAIKTLS